MPPRKEVKEAIVYPASKKRPPPFKPLRPLKVPRIATTESESSVRSRTPAHAPARHKAVKHASAQPSKVIAQVHLDDSDDDGGDLEDGVASSIADSSDGDNDLDEDVLNTRPRKPGVKGKAAVRARPQENVSRHERSTLSIEEETRDRGREEELLTERNSAPSESSDLPSIPQPLLLRLLHDAFEDKTTKIDTHAIEVVQKYVEIFVREAIERARLEKQEAQERGEVSEMDSKWLELEDLEKVAPAMILDF